MTVQIILPSIGALSLRFATLKGSIGIFNLSFWVTLTASFWAFFYYACHYFLEPDPPFFSYTYQLGLMDIATLFVFRIIVDVFNLCCFIYIAKKRQIAKAAVYSTLGTFFTIIVNILMGLYPWWIYPYIVAIYIGYTLIGYDRNKVFSQQMKETIRIRFVLKLTDDYKIMQEDDFIFDANLNNEELDQTISKGLISIILEIVFYMIDIFI